MTRGEHEDRGGAHATILAQSDEIIARLQATYDDLQRCAEADQLREDEIRSHEEAERLRKQAARSHQEAKQLREQAERRRVEAEHEAARSRAELEQLKR